jgi:DNA polymerase/3'-5' exonuclease PolX
MKINLPINEVLPIAELIRKELEPHCIRIEILGSLRRGKEMVGDVELLVIPKGVHQISLFNSNRVSVNVNKELIDAVRQFNVYKGGLENEGRMVQFFGPNDIPIDLFIASHENYGYQKVIRTGPLEHNVGFIIPLLKQNGYTLRDAHIWSDGYIVSVAEEEDLYKLINIDIIPPADRKYFTTLKKVTTNE